MEVGTTSIKFADQYSVLQGMMASFDEAIATLSAKAQRPDMNRAQRRAIQSQINGIKVKLMQLNIRMGTLRQDAEKLGVMFDAV